MVSISDFCWLLDFSGLVILESTERWSKSPLGMLGASLGHPIPLDSFSIRIIDTRSRHERRIPLVTDLDYGMGVVMGGACVEWWNGPLPSRISATTTGAARLSSCTSWVPASEDGGRCTFEERR